MSRRQFFPSADRNRHDILPVLRALLAEPALVLEIASGTGQHAVYFARELPHLTWQPTDRDPVAVDSIAAWREEEELSNVLPPLRLDVSERPWPVERADTLVCINMIHISPWQSTLDLLEGAGEVLGPGGPLIFYGAFFFADRPTAPSNLEFDRSLRHRDPAWGVRALEAVVREAEARGLAFDRVVDMPGNNFMVVLRRSQVPG